MDEIRLPKSGFVLKPEVPSDYPDFRCFVIVGLVLRIYRDQYGAWHARTVGGGHNDFNTRDEAIAWLDAHVLKLRASLLPPGARIVEDTPETREKVARRLYELHAQTWKEFNGSVDRPWEDTGLQTRMLGFADAVLAALGVSK